MDLKACFDNLVHRTILAKVAERVQDNEMLALLKLTLKGAGKRGIPQGSPLSPLLANLMLTNLDKALDRGKDFATYVRYLDDMVVLVPLGPKGELWARHAKARIQKESEAIGVSINDEKTRTLTVTKAGGSFCFLGFAVRWSRSPKSKKWYPHTEPRKEKIRDLRQKVKRLLDARRFLKVEDAVAQINQIIRGWVNYFRGSNAARVFGAIRWYIELLVRRFAGKQRNRRGFGWNRWSNEVVYQKWGLYNQYKIFHGNGLKKINSPSKGSINPI